MSWEIKPSNPARLPDLRQDMLTLQVMRIMDAKWKNYNLDYCMTLYEVLPMGQNVSVPSLNLLSLEWKVLNVLN